MSAPHAHTWDEVPRNVQEQVRFLYGALLQGAIEVDANPEPGQPKGHHYSSGLTVWDYLPLRMKTAMANMLMAQRHEANKAITECVRAILVDVVHPRNRFGGAVR